MSIQKDSNGYTAPAFKTGPHGQHGTVKGSGFFFSKKKKKKRNMGAREGELCGAIHEQQDFLDLMVNMALKKKGKEKL